MFDYEKFHSSFLCSISDDCDIFMCSVNKIGSSFAAFNVTRQCCLSRSSLLWPIKIIVVSIRKSTWTKYRDDFPFPSIIHFSCYIPPEKSNVRLTENPWQCTNLWSSTIRSMITKCMIFKIKQKISSVFIRQHFLKLEFFDEVPPQIREKVNNDSTNDFLTLLFS